MTPYAGPASPAHPARPATIEDMYAGFRAPPPIYSPVPIWWWSGEPLERERLGWQMERLVEGGVRNVIVLNLAPRGPLFGCVADDPPFETDDWWDIFIYVLEEAKRRGLAIWFYDQLGFSGARLQERLITDHPSCAGASLERLEADLHPGEVAELVAPPGATVLSAAAGRLTPPDRLTDLQDLSAAVEEGTRLWWTAPTIDRDPDTGAASVWRVLLFYTRPEGFDYLNPDAAARLIDTVHGEFARRCGAYMGTTLVGSFQDEFPGLPRWTRDFAAQFHQRLGYDLLPWLPALFYECGPRTPAVRVTYSELVATLAEEAFFRPLFDWHERRGLLCGYDQIHRARAADPVDGQAYYGDYIRTMRHFSAPGCDMDGAARPHASIAHLYGRPRVWIEGFHSAGWGQTIEDIVTLLHPWYREGATLYNPHAVYYSTRGSWWEWAPPDTSWRQPYWRHYPVFASYVARLSYLLSQGDHVCDIALLYPASTMQAELIAGTPTERGRAVRGLWWELNRLLDDERRDADIIDDDSLARARVEAGRLCVAGERYRTLILPGTTTLRRESAAQVRAFADGGGLVIYCGSELPFASADAGVGDPRLREVVAALFGDRPNVGGATPDRAHWLHAPEGLAALLDARLPRAVVGGVVPATAGAERPRTRPSWYPNNHDQPEPDLTRRAPHLPSLHRRVAGCDLFFVLADTETRADDLARFHVAERDHGRVVDASRRIRRVAFRATGAPEVWDALTGEVRPARVVASDGDSTEALLDFGPSPACLVLFRPGEVGVPDRGASPAHQNQAEATGDAQARVDVESSDVDIRTVMGPWRSRLWPTLDNRWGDVALPPSPESPPVDCRVFRYRVESADDDGVAGGWGDPTFDDASWETVTASFGPYWWARGPLTIRVHDEAPGPADRPHAIGDWRPCVYSQRLGIAKDPVYGTQLGPRGHIPEDFIDLGTHPAGAVFEVVTTVRSATEQNLVALVGSTTSTRLWVNGVEIPALPETIPALWRGAVHLSTGPNDVRLRLESVDTDAGDASRPPRVRLWVRFAALEEDLRQGSWMWVPAELEARAGLGRRYFRRMIDLDEAPVEAPVRVSGDNGFRLFVNGRLVDTQGECDAYIMGHVTAYDLAPHLMAGRNVVAVEALPGARDHGDRGAERRTPQAAFILDGEARLPHGQRVELSSGREWRCATTARTAEWPSRAFDDSAWVAARELAAPPMWFPGEPSVLLFRPRPHPLSDVSWLHGSWAAGPDLGLTYDAYPASSRPVGWYRFTLPPGTASLRVRTRGTWRLYVDGTPLADGSSDDAAADIAVPASRHGAATAHQGSLRIEHEPGAYGGAAIPTPITFTVEAGTIDLGAWANQGMAHYAGGLVYETEVDLAADNIDEPLELDLGRVRGSVEAWLNDEPLGVRLWHPYRFPLAGHMKAGRNTLRILVLNTLGPHYGAANPSPLLYHGQDVSGLFGPVHIVRGHG